MGNICSCDESGARDSIQGNILQEEALKRKGTEFCRMESVDREAVDHV